MANEWHYAQDGARHGPVSTDELRRLAAEGALAPTDLIWKAGMQEWTPASRARGLFTGDTVPPELPSGVDAGPPPVPQDERTVPAGRRRRTRGGARDAHAASSGFWAGFTAADRPWSAGWMVVLIILTIVLAPLSIGFGIYGLTKRPKKAQGAILIVISIAVFLAALWLRESVEPAGPAPTVPAPRASRGIPCPGCRGTGGDRSSTPCIKCARDSLSFSRGVRSTGYVGGRPCPVCRGTGYHKPCRSCGGRGVVSR